MKTLTPTQRGFLQILDNLGGTGRLGTYGDGLVGNAQTVDKLHRLGLIKIRYNHRDGDDFVELTRKGYDEAQRRK